MEIKQGTLTREWTKSYFYHHTLQCTESAQEVVSVGSGPLHLGTLRIQQIACAEKLALLLTHDGAVYTLPYDTMTPQLVPGKFKLTNIYQYIISF